MSNITRPRDLPFMPMTRRQMLASAGCGFGMLALRGLSAQAALLEQPTEVLKNPLAARHPPMPAKAKRVIMLFMQGGPSHLDTFDYKPKLAAGGDGGGKGKLLPSPFTFKRQGKNGLWMSELFPNVARHADDLCMINSMHTDNPAHPQATIQLHTGSVQFVRPSVGAWVLYGLGTMNQNLPGFITINPPSGLGGAQNYGSAFLPASFQGTRIDGSGMPDIASKEPPKLQRRQLDLLQAMNREAQAHSGSPDQVEGVIQSYELGFKMQSAVPEVLDISKESAATKEMYGIGEGKGMDNFGKQCLMARRLAQAGVRYIEVTHGGWDQHNNLRAKMTENAGAVDKPIAGLMADLKAHGMLNDTLVIWGGEFGRTPGGQNGDGRNHNNRGYTMWMAGGGAKPGVYGKTDDTGGTATENPVHVHDLHATILSLLGLDPEALTYKYAGRDFRLIDVKGHVVRELMV